MSLRSSGLSSAALSPQKPARLDALQMRHRPIVDVTPCFPDAAIVARYREWLPQILRLGEPGSAAFVVVEDRKAGFRRVQAIALALHHVVGVVRWTARRIRLAQLEPDPGQRV